MSEIPATVAVEAVQSDEYALVQQAEMDARTLCYHLFEIDIAKDRITSDQVFEPKHIKVTIRDGKGNGKIFHIHTGDDKNHTSYREHLNAAKKRLDSICAHTNAASAHLIENELDPCIGMTSRALSSNLFAITSDKPLDIKYMGIFARGEEEEEKRPFFIELRDGATPLKQ